MPKLTPAELQRASQKVTWWHSVPLGDGHATRGTKAFSVNQELAKWKFPADLTGKTVLDIGCNDGGYSVAALERGASHVLAVDANLTDGMRFLLEHDVHPFEFRQLDLFAEAFLQLPTFDFVIFAGVLYHVLDPILALRRVRQVTRGTALIETHVDERVSHIPCIAFYEKTDLNNDATNWWGPNRLCLDAMLRTVGFTVPLIASWDYNEGFKMGRICYHATPV
ncbi:MAG TPA: methyltransferase domain-containing protein [Symbiobacteriaceae bacterium]|jgi:tRNA (mo5U34)-methyltransferase